jgi:hypothetical protein
VVFRPHSTNFPPRLHSGSLFPSEDDLYVYVIHLNPSSLLKHTFPTVSQCVFTNILVVLAGLRYFALGDRVFVFWSRAITHKICYMYAYVKYT